MKEEELRAVSTCGICTEKIGKSAMPMFFRVRIDRYALDGAAMQRQQGLGLQIGGQLAQVMGPDEDLAKKIHTNELTVCMNCACGKQISIVELEEDKSEDESEPIKELKDS